MPSTRTHETKRKPAPRKPAKQSNAGQATREQIAAVIAENCPAPTGSEDPTAQATKAADAVMALLKHH